MSTYFPYSYLILTLCNNKNIDTAASFFGEWSVGECKDITLSTVKLAKISELYY